MKILIMGLGKLKFMPYINFYSDSLDRKENDIHILYWNRDLQSESTAHLEGITLHEFDFFQQDDVPKASKLAGFLKYRRYALRLLKKESFDFIIVLHSLTGVVVGDYLTKHFKNRFILDYRDVTYESLPPFKKAVARLVENSRFTFVSSSSFKSFLPQEHKEKIYTIHNIDIKALAYSEQVKAARTNSEKIRMGFWGFIRDESLNMKILMQLGNDSRFELHYFGREQQIAHRLKAYSAQQGFENVFFHGEYSPEEKYEFVKAVDLIHNIYDDKGAMLAVGNKYYDGLVFSIPQVCMPRSYMGELCTANGVGFVADPYNPNFKNELYEAFCKINSHTLEEGCKAALANIQMEQEQAITLIKNLFATKQKEK